jgi:hypothetical protein
MVHLGEQAHEEKERRQLVPVWPPGEGRPPASPAHKKDQKVIVSSRLLYIYYLLEVRRRRRPKLQESIHVTGEFHRLLTC